MVVLSVLLGLQTILKDKQLQFPNTFAPQYLQVWGWENRVNAGQSLSASWPAMAEACERQQVQVSLLTE